MAFSNDASDFAAAKEGGRKRKRSESEWRPPPTKWRTQTEQKSYSSKLLEALRRVRRSKPAEEARRRSRALREAADRALAVAARGRTRWSRAILSSRRLKIKPRRPHPHITVPSASVGGCAAAKKKKRSPVIEGKAAVLGRLVPGCQRISFPSVLEEASDYIPALEMQVRAMAALVAILSASSESSSPESDHTAT